MGGGGKGGTSTSSVTIPPEVLARYNAVNATAENVAQQPFQAYSTDPNAFVAPVNAVQASGINNIYNAQNAAQPWYQQAGQAANQGYGQGQNYLQAATNYAQAGGLGINPQQYNDVTMARYMSPFANQVIGGTLAPLQQQQAQDQQALTSQNIKAGAFGGDRAAITDAVLRGQQEMATGNVVGGLLNPMFNQAQQEFNTQQGVNLAAQQANRQAIQQTGQTLGALGQQGYGMGTGLASLYGNLGTSAQNAAISGGQAALLQALFHSKHNKQASAPFIINSSSSRATPSKSRNSWQTLPKALAPCLDLQQRQRSRHRSFPTNVLKTTLSQLVKHMMVKRSLNSVIKAKKGQSRLAWSRKTSKSIIQTLLATIRATKLSIMIRQHAMQRPVATSTKAALFPRQKAGQYILATRVRVMREVAIMAAAAQRALLIRLI